MLPNPRPKSSTISRGRVADLRKRAESNYLIFYRVAGDVEVVRILHAARDWTHLLFTDED